MELKRIEIKSFKKLDKPVRVYDLSVTDNHNFFIGNSSTLTHNCDYLTPDAQAALRNMMEVFSDRTRFILTCNYVERIIAPIISRCQTFALTPPSKKEVAVHLTTILNDQKVEFDKQGIATLVNAYYPDIRRIVNNAQLQTRDGKLTVNINEVIAADSKLKVLDVLTSNQTAASKVNDIRQIVADSGIRDFTELYRLLYNKATEYNPNKIPQTILAIAEGSYRDTFVIDKEICFMATIYNILLGN
jgi:replication factor C small subunit